MKLFKLETTENFKPRNLLRSSVLVEIASYSLILLFLYAAINKLVIFEEFQQQMTQSPLLPRQLIPFLAVFVPLSEIVIAWMLVFDKTKQLGFYLSFSLMFIFTMYLVILVSAAEKVPCSCGGILDDMGYPEHIIFNTIFTGIALFGSLKFQRTERGNVKSVSIKK